MPDQYILKLHAEDHSKMIGQVFVLCVPLLLKPTDTAGSRDRLYAITFEEDIINDIAFGRIVFLHIIE